MIDLGYVVSAVVVVVLLAIFKDNLEPIWRLALGLGILPPLSVLYCKYIEKKFGLECYTRF